MSPSESVTFEISVRQDGRWLHKQSEESEETARAEAQAMVASGEFDAVKITEASPGRDHGKIIFEEVSGARDGQHPIVVPIERAPRCKSAADVFGFESRKTMGRVLRAWLDAEIKTPMELLHEPDQLRFLARDRDLAVAALRAVAMAQSRGGDVDPRKRYEELEALMAEVQEMIPDAKDAAPFGAAVMEDGLDGLHALVVGRFDPPDRPFWHRVGLAQATSRGGDWTRKLDHLVKLLDQDLGEEVRSIVDEAIAEIVDGEAALDEILPPLPNMGDRLRRLADLSEGRLQCGEEEDAVACRLNGLFARFQMPLTQWSLLERAQRLLTGFDPLTKDGDPNAEKEMFTGLLGALSGLDGVLGGPLLCEALVQRARIAMPSREGELSMEDGIKAVLRLIHEPGARLGAVIDMLNTPLGRKNRRFLLSKGQEIFETFDKVERLFSEDTSPEKVKAAARSLCGRLADRDLHDHWAMEMVQNFRIFLGEAAADEKHQSRQREQGPPVVRSPMDAPGSKDMPLGFRTLEPGEVLFREGELGTEAYLIMSGRINVTFKAGERDAFLAALGPGEILGEMSIVDDQPRIASARAVDKTELRVIQREAFKQRLDRLEHTDKVLRRLLDVFVERLRAQVRAFR